MARIERGDAPRFPPAIPARRPRWPGAVVVAVAAAAAGLLWLREPPPPAPLAAASLAALSVSTPGASPEVRSFQTHDEGQDIAIPGFASLWIEAHSRGTLAEGARLRILLDEGAVSLDVIPQPEPDRVEVLAGNFRVSVKGTRFRVARRAGQVDVDVERGAVQVTALDDSVPPALLRGSSGSTFSAASSAPSGVVLNPTGARPFRPFVLGASPSEPPTPPVAVVAPGPARSVASPGSSPAPSLLSPADLRVRAHALASSCVASSSSVAPGVVVTIETTLTLVIGASGKVDTFSFSPPLAPATEQCFQGGNAKLRGPAGRHAVPLTLSLGGR